MFNRVLFSLGLLTVAMDFTLRAQDSKVNSSLGVGMTVPTTSMGRLAGAGVNTSAGLGYNFDRHNAFIGEFMYAHLPPTREAIQPVSAATQVTGLSGSGNLMTVTGNYRFMMEGKALGAYIIVGGGMYYRIAELSKAVTVKNGTSCNPSWQWWGYSCVGGLVSQDESLLSTSSTAFGGNVGAGLTIRVSEEGYKVFVESRYHYAPNRGTPTQFIAITFGVRW
jgi:hypothetical protein